jgi:cell wall assembly regulator SMI1
MQKFTRALTREIEVAGERLAVTFSEEGMTLRPVGSRRPPCTMSWNAVVCACVEAHAAEPPTAEKVSESVKALKGGEKASRARRTAEPETAETPAETTPAEEEAGEPPVAAPPPAAKAEAKDRDGASLSALLSRLDHWLGAHRSRYREGLLAGASPAELGSLQEALGGTVPDDLRTWLGWHNGQDPEVFGSLAEAWHPMSAAEIAEVKEELDAAGHPGWQREWIPFLDDDDGSYLVLDPTQPGTPVRECWRGRAEHAVVAPSLAAWVRQLVSGLEQGQYQEDAERGGMHRG